MLLFLLAACGVENNVASIEDKPAAEPVDNSATVRDAAACPTNNHTDLMPTQSSVSAATLATAAQNLTAMEQRMQTALPRMLADTPFTTSQLASGQVAADLVILGDQPDSFDEEGDYAGLLVFGAETSTLEAYVGASLVQLAEDESLNGIYSRALVKFGSTQTMNYECGVFVDGVEEGKIDMRYATDTTGAGTVWTSESTEIPITDAADNQNVQDAMYDADLKIAETATGATGATLDTPDWDVLKVFRLNAHLAEE